jgi:hypothetical protein
MPPALAVSDPAVPEFIAMKPVSPLTARHWQAVVAHAAPDVLPNSEAMAAVTEPPNVQRQKQAPRHLLF